MQSSAKNNKAPYRVGAKQKLAVLDKNGVEVVIFKKGQEEMAAQYCEILNNISKK